jgi:hypothetical protein
MRRADFSPRGISNSAMLFRELSSQKASAALQEIKSADDPHPLIVRI